MDALEAEKSEVRFPRYPAAIQRLVHIEIPSANLSGQVRVSPILQLRRMWPQSCEHFNLEYVGADGQRIVGQWLADQAHFWRRVKTTACASPASTAQVLPLPALNVLLQLGGADRKLPGLAALVAQPAAQLLVHQPERRAVVYLPEMNRAGYAKVVRPIRVADLAAIMRTVQRQAYGHFATPEVLAVHQEEGVIMLSALPGVSLYDLLGSTTLVAAAQGAGDTLRSLHRLSPPTFATKHGVEDEINVLQRWLDRLALVAPALSQLANKRREAVFAKLATGSFPTVLLHRDFYDKQIFFAPCEPMGLLDFDTLAVGEAALDIANVLVHWELRALQGACTQAQARAATAAFCASYRIGRALHQRLQAYAEATRLRLVCVYACRPAGLPFSQMLLERLDASLWLGE